MMVRSPKSIRAKITAVATLLAATLLVVMSFVMTALFRWQLTDNFDEGLADRADAISANLSDEMNGTLPMEEDLLIQMLDSNGAVKRSSSNLDGVVAFTNLRPGYRTIKDVPGRSETFRVFVSDTTKGPDKLTVLVGVNYDDVLDPVHLMSQLLAISVPITLGALAAISWLLTGRTLRPVEAIRSEMASITTSSLHRRMPRADTGDEIDRLAETMNLTLDRLEDSVRRQQRFVADASHEMYGPLTRMRTELEVALAHPHTAEPTATHISVLAEAVGLQHLVEDLLLLARSDAGGSQAQFQLVDLDDIVGFESRRLRESGRVLVDTRDVAAAQVIGDTHQLARAVRNLLDNAQRHALSVVTVSLHEIDDVVVLTIADDGGGIADDLRAHIFERFTRLDEARTRDAGGAGLGLAITTDIVERHGGRLILAAGLPTRFQLFLPLG